MRSSLLAALALSACATVPVVDTDAERIEQGMKREVFSESTPGADGIPSAPSGDDSPLHSPSYSLSNLFPHRGRLYRR
jgi:hypothetical protein